MSARCFPSDIPFFDTTFLLIPRCITTSPASIVSPFHLYFVYLQHRYCTCTKYVDQETDSQSSFGRAPRHRVYSRGNAPNSTRDSDTGSSPLPHTSLWHKIVVWRRSVFYRKLKLRHKTWPQGISVTKGTKLRLVKHCKRGPEPFFKCTSGLNISY